MELSTHAPGGAGVGRDFLQLEEITGHPEESG